MCIVKKQNKTTRLDKLNRNTFNSSPWVQVRPPAQHHLCGVTRGQGSESDSKVERTEGLERHSSKALALFYLEARLRNNGGSERLATNYSELPDKQMCAFPSSRTPSNVKQMLGCNSTAITFLSYS